MKRWYILLGCWFVLCMSVTSDAALSLKLTQGISGAIPVGLQPFQQDSLATVAGNTTISAVIHNDLQNSGQFHVVEPGILDTLRPDQAKLDLTRWQKRGVDTLITGQLKSLSDGRYRVSFKLFNVYTPKQPALLSQSFVTTAGGMRHLAHHISDLIYKKLTGTRGIFSTKIAYVVDRQKNAQDAHYELVVADADGFGPHVLLSSSQPIMSPTWTPNGQSIAYVSFEGHRESIYLQNLASGKRRLISDFPGINSAPAFSPDGHRLALVLTKTGNPKIYIFNLLTHYLTQLTHGYSIDTEPAWAPDGQSILFTSSRGGSPQIYRDYLKGKRVERITFDGNYNARASFLPNGQAVIMMHRETTRFGIAKQDLGTGFIQSLSNSGSDESPSVSPNGRMIIYARESGDHRGLAVVSVDGRIRLRLPSRDGNVQEPAWSPFLKA